MGYLLIFGAVILNVVKAYASKKLSRQMSCIADNLDLSLIRNAFCVVIGAFFILVANGCNFTLPTVGIAICILGGAAMSLNYVAWVMALKTDALVFASVANNANFIVAAVAGLVIFHEGITWAKGVAILFVLAAMLFMVKYQKGIGGVPSLKDFALLFVVFFAGGMSSVAEKWFKTALPDTSTHIYTFYSFLFSILLLLLARVFIRVPRPVAALGGSRAKKIIGFIPFGLLMGASVYGVTYFKTMANSYLDAVVLYPLNNGLTFVGSCLMAWACFKEKPNRFSIIGMILVFIALLLSSGTAEEIFARVLG